jgi:hypothetical protein
LTDSIVHVVHCIDTEGPLYESLPETFKRLKELFDIDLSPSMENLEKIQKGLLDLDGLEEEVARVFSSKLINYNDTWDKVDDMLKDIMSEDFRNHYPDSFGGGWIYNWHCVDFIGYSENPRRRDMGYHQVFDHYRFLIESNETNKNDGLHFHYHPMAFSKKAHYCATHYFATGNRLFEILARDIIDRHWFPGVYRPGFHVARPDSHWFLEQFVPFDYGNQGMEEDGLEQKDLANGRYGDWRRAPRNWQPYHPSHDDYQIPGDCRRWITRCLNVGARYRSISQKEVNQAFSEAESGAPVILAFTNHDFRDMRPDINLMQEMLAEAQQQFPKVKFKYCEGREGFRQALGLAKTSPCQLSLSFEGNVLRIESDKKTFGPQPFFAIKTQSGEYFHDNLDFQEPFRSWTYTFDQATFELSSLGNIGIAAGDDTGNITIVDYNVLLKQSSIHYI